MTRRGRRLIRGALRLGLLLSGVLAAWASHEAASTDVAYAADQPPVVAVKAALGRTTGILGPAASGPAVGETPRPAPAGTPAPVADALRQVTEPVRGGVLAPVADLLHPVTEPVRAGVLTPAADLLHPVTEPLSPVLAPVGRELQPVLQPLDPVLQPLKPVTDLLGLPTDPHTAPPPPATGPGGGPTDETPPPSSGPSAPVTTPPTPVANPPAPVTTPPAPITTPPPTIVPSAPAGPVAAGPGRAEFAPDTTAVTRHTAGALSPTGPHGPRPLRSDADAAPVHHAPGGAELGSSSGVHGHLADACAAGWASPTLSGRRCHPLDGDALRSRSPRPGTRPA